MSLRLTLLGTGAPLHPDRASTGMVVTAPGCEPLLIDTCGGLELARQLLAAGFPLPSVRHVIVTHGHLDHSGGIQALFLARQPLDIYASADTHAAIKATTVATFPEWEQHVDIVSHHVRSDETRDVGGYRVTFFDVVHRVPTLAVRVEVHGKVFAFSADCCPCEGAIAAARHADLFVCDAICADSDGSAAIARAHATLHPTAREAALMAKQANAKHLVCTHIGRFGNACNILAEASAHFDGSVSVAQDGGIYDV